MSIDRVEFVVGIHITLDDLFENNAPNALLKSELRNVFQFSTPSRQEFIDNGYYGRYKDLRTHTDFRKTNPRIILGLICAVTTRRLHSDVGLEPETLQDAIRVVDEELEGSPFEHLLPTRLFCLVHWQW